MSAQDALTQYGADRIGLRFGVKDALHPAGHHGQDVRLPGGGGSAVVAYEECVVVESGTEVTRGFTSILGWYLVARAKSDGRFLGWAHLRRGTRASVGDVLKPGDLVGLAASGPLPSKALGPDVAGINYPGTAWSAPHIHTTDGKTAADIFAGNTVDPLPRIQRALARLAPAGTGTLTPVVTKPAPVTPPPPPLPKEEVDMIRIQHAERGIALIAGGYFKQLANDEEVRGSDKLVQVGVPHINAESAREWDVLRALAQNGTLAAHVLVGLTVDDVRKAVAEALAAAKVAEQVDAI
jgi:hypothetical protein